jgi:hypothetical protein
MMEEEELLDKTYKRNIEEMTHYRKKLGRECEYQERFSIFYGPNPRFLINQAKKEIDSKDD